MVVTKKQTEAFARVEKKFGITKQNRRELINSPEVRQALLEEGAFGPTRKNPVTGEIERAPPRKVFDPRTGREEFVFSPASIGGNLPKSTQRIISKDPKINKRLQSRPSPRFKTNVTRPSRTFETGLFDRPTTGPVKPSPPLTPEERAIVKKKADERAKINKLRLDPVRDSQGNISETKFKVTDQSGKVRIVDRKEAGRIGRIATRPIFAGKNLSKSQFKGFILAGTDDGETVFIKRTDIGKFGTLKRDPDIPEGQRPVSLVDSNLKATPIPVIFPSQRSNKGSELEFIKPKTGKGVFVDITSDVKGTTSRVFIPEADKTERKTSPGFVSVPFNPQPDSFGKLVEQSNFGNFFPSRSPAKALDSVSLGDPTIARKRRSKLRGKNGKKKNGKRKQKPLKSIFDLSF